MIEFFTFLFVGGILFALAGFGLALLLAIGAILMLPLVYIADLFRTNQ